MKRETSHRLVKKTTTKSPGQVNPAEDANIQDRSVRDEFSVLLVERMFALHWELENAQSLIRL